MIIHIKAREVKIMRPVHQYQENEFNTIANNPFIVVWGVFWPTKTENTDESEFI